MNLVESFQNLVAQVPELIQPLIIALAGAVPFIEGEGAAAIGIIGGLNPVVAAMAGIVGNFLCVALLVLLSSGARGAIVNRSRARRVGVGAGSPAVADAAAGGSSLEDGSPRKAKFQKAFERYGVPGVSLLGPLLLPTQFTAVMLAGAGVSKGRILVWQGIAIVLWTTAVTLVITGVISAVG
ncbi:small multidrug efflux protein [Microbacterium sp. SSM24]|uniref:small multidrug efflux protein n=1 Tax=Microbacterium sp. SSM24 TaxID=2991714 RepID=UPI0022262D26|nr:small multidrug efflux protein [Microbacterium sp. SSM24]MCW3493880.1 small multidrug efflux protein [Microbacterium sp. SSM24]